MKHLTHLFGEPVSQFPPYSQSVLCLSYKISPLPFKVGVNITARYDLALRVPRGPFRVHKTMNNRVLVLRLVPGFDDQVGV